MMLQSAVLAVGAYLVIHQEATGGIIIAGSILSARALAPVDLDAFARDRALSAAGLETPATALIPGTRLVSTPAALDGLRRQMAEALDAFHRDNADLQGIGREKLRLALDPRLSRPDFTAFLRHDAEAGRIALDGAFVRLPGHLPRLSPEDEAMLARILPRLSGEDRFRPPRTRDFATEFGAEEAEVRRILRMAARQGRIDQIAHDHFFARATTREMVSIIRDLAGPGNDWFTAPAFRDRVQNGRKVAIQILDFFDRHGLTLRRGDLRRINPHRIDLFGEADGPGQGA